MNKVFVFIIICSLASCNMIPGHYGWEPARDSSEKYFQLASCAFACNKSDSGRLYMKKQFYWADSMLHVMGGPTKSVAEIKKEEDAKCNCK